MVHAALKKKKHGKRLSLTAIAFAFVFSGSFAWAQSPVSQEQWIGAVQDQLRKNLRPPVNTDTFDRDQPVRLRLTVLRDGSVGRVTVDESSGHTDADQAALNMIGNSGRLPPFSPDMTGATIEIVLPVTIVAMPSTSDPAPPIRPADSRYIDAGTGFRLTVPLLFEIVRPQSDANYDIVVDVVSLLNTPPLAGTSKSLCRAGFKASPQTQSVTQKDLSAPAAIEARISAMQTVQSALQGRIEETHVFDQIGAKGIEFVIAPGFGPDHGNVRQYTSLLDLPEGRITVSCATSIKAMPDAINTFRSIREGTTLSRQLR